jgi:hypothetical protein
MKGQKSISLFEIAILLIASISFTYFIGLTNIPTVSASQLLDSGCCIENINGAACQEMLITDEQNCASNLVATSCSYVEQCQNGCCYNPEQGECSLNTPKKTCEETGGNWSDSPTCNIQQCDLGCCIIGDQASEVTSRECTLLSRQWQIEPQFLQRDPIRGCEDYTGQTIEGACVWDSGDFSGEKECVRTTKSNCNHAFYPGYLCTSEELNTLCEPTEDTTCVADKDQIYFEDSCGNIANIYDASRASDQTYWNTILSKQESCQQAGPGCGNCEYSTGSICHDYRPGEDPEPTMGNAVCRDLNCDNGRKHGESWCVYDYAPLEGIAPVGTRHFMATCLDGEINLNGCADGMQELCIENTDEASNRSAAMCVPNEWRTCLNANDEDSYELVKDECDKYTQCVMFDEMYGKENLLRSDGTTFATFQDSVNSLQGAAGKVGKNSNSIITYCVPRFTPGFQFWPDNNRYGGSEEETQAICSMGDTVCVSHKERKCTLTSCDSWKDVENWECNINGEHATIPGEDLPNFMKAVNERCRAIGTCGTTINIAGEEGRDEGWSINRVKIDKAGEEKEGYGEDIYYELFDADISSDGLIKPGEMQEVPYSSYDFYAEAYQDTGLGEISPQDFNILSIVPEAQETYIQDNSMTDLIFMGLGALSSIALGSGVGSTIAGGFTTITTGLVPGMEGLGAVTQITPVGGAGAGIGAGAAVVVMAVFAVAGYQLGKVIAGKQGWSPAHQAQFANAMAGYGAAVGATGTVLYAFAGEGGAAFGFGSALGAFGTIGAIGLIIAAIYAIYETFFNEFEESEYYILKFNCEAWEPPTEGDCTLCNDDVRPCSEYRCRSLGSNCRYFTDLGEPGWCADRTQDIWQAIITPWEEPLTNKTKYTNVGDYGFEIQGKTTTEIPGWTSLTFGIETDKQALCKLSPDHMQDYSQIPFYFQTEDKLHHKITLSSYINQSTISGSTPGMDPGENEYYIKCKNFAGEINDADFVMQVEVGEGPDLMAPQIKSISPENGALIPFNTSDAEVKFAFNEPTECKYSIEYDYLTYDEMPNQMACLTSQPIFGEWLCVADLKNMTNPTKVFVKCKDSQENEFSQSYVYNLGICQEPLEIQIISPTESVIQGKYPLNISLEAITSGCSSSATCEYSFSPSGTGITFAETGSEIHTQIFDQFNSGNQKIFVSCEDDIGNTAQTSINFTTEVDSSYPEITRFYESGNKLVIITNENSRCMFSTDDTKKCSFEFQESSATSLGRTHSEGYTPSETYYIKCADEFGNLPSGCSQTIRLLN